MYVDTKTMSENQREMQFVAWQNSSLQHLNMQQIRYYIRYIYISEQIFSFFFNEFRGLKSGHSFTSASKLISLLLHFRDASKIRKFDFSFPFEFRTQKEATELFHRIEKSKMNPPEFPSKSFYCFIFLYLHYNLSL